MQHLRTSLGPGDRDRVGSRKPGSAWIDLRENHRKTIGKPWENHRKTICQWIDLMENLNRKPWFLHVFTIK